MTKRAWITSVGVLVLIAAAMLSAGAQQPGPQEPLSQADALFDQKNYKEAAELYEAALETKLTPQRIQHAYEHIILCKLRLRLFDDALEAAEQFVERTSRTYREARARRQAGNLYMLIPHWGTRAGGEFFRGEWKQGIQLRSEKHDKRLAVAHLERARELYAAYDLRLASGKGVPGAKRPVPKEEREAWHGERIACIFDLANCLSRFSIYENDWRWWHRWWGERDEFIAETAGEEDFDEYHSDSEMRRKRPIGLRVDEDGKPIFPTAPKDYSGGLSDDRNILYLLAEVRELDKTKEGKFAVLSYYRQAMLARARFGMDRINSYAGM
ncbi:MAG: tetratricopeptide repeat protein, partial [Candidatus Brocadiia bacterium]|nr:tetratricopeptide repeat protein [Candidatus Brocadiia bacterium]